MAKPTKSVRKESDDLIFAVCELFFKRIISDAGEKDPTDKKTGKKGRRPRPVWQKKSPRNSDVLI